MAEHLASPVTDKVTDLNAVRLTDDSDSRKWLLRTDLWSVPIGRSRRVEDTLVFSISPGEWIVVGGRPSADAVDLTHVRALFRISGRGARNLLERVCALDLSEDMTPDGGAARTLVAGVATELVRKDREGEPTYLLLMSRSFAWHMWNRLVAVGREE